MFVTVGGEDRARNFFRRAQIGIKSGGRERKIKDVSKNSDNNINI